MATDTTEKMAEVAAEVAGETAKKAGATGMPQLDFATYPNQIFWLLVALLAIYFILSRVVLPRIAAVLAERQDTITRDLDTAEALKRQAVEAEEAYHKALADARAEAGRIIAESKAEIQAELDAAVTRADAEIAARAAEGEKAIAAIRKDARDSVKKVATATARELVAHLGIKADARAVTAAVTARMKG